MFNAFDSWRRFFIVATLFVSTTTIAVSADSWAPVKHAMLTRWGKKVSPDGVWSEYPRPQMTRPEWTNLNGLWDYAVTDLNAEKPSSWDGKILVPFAIESPLSGVGKRLTAEQSLWYRTTFDSADLFSGESDEKTTSIRLHFEAVDYRCEVWLNGVRIGEHTGGNLPFSLLVEEPLKDTGNELVVKVIDATDAEGKYQLRGKQRVNNRGIFYTPVSGIWQTVWIEPVPKSHIAALKVNGNDQGTVTVEAATVGEASGIRLTVRENKRVVAKVTSSNSNATLSIANPKLWSPESPKLYDIQVDLVSEDGSVVDSVGSYVGLRSVGKRRDPQGDLRLTLNGKDIFHWGPLDQGWWPDGLLTPPADEAIRFEIDFLKRSGFNMIRKHIKVEPRRYYYHCDKMGMLVWQDQVSGGRGPKWTRLDPNPSDAKWSDADHRQYLAEFDEMVDALENHPSIVVWVPFNEAWGQHRTVESGEWIAQRDPTRLVNIASGGNFWPVGDVVDEHRYPHPGFPFDPQRYADYIKVMGEFGGHGWAVKGHLWDANRDNWGYGGLPQSAEEYKQRYLESIRLLKELKGQGIAAGVYTQTTDVEGEINGLMTYDRKVLKLPAAELKQIHQGLVP